MNKEISKDEREEFIIEARKIAIENKGKLRYKLERLIFYGLVLALYSFCAGFGFAIAANFLGYEGLNQNSIGALVAVLLILGWPQMSLKLEDWYLKKEIDVVSKNAV